MFKDGKVDRLECLPLSWKDFHYNENDFQFFPPPPRQEFSAIQYKNLHFCLRRLLRKELGVERPRNSIKWRIFFEERQKCRWWREDFWLEKKCINKVCHILIRFFLSMKLWKFLFRQKFLLLLSASCPMVMLFLVDVFTCFTDWRPRFFWMVKFLFYVACTCLLLKSFQHENLTRKILATKSRDNWKLWHN